MSTTVGTFEPQLHWCKGSAKEPIGTIISKRVDNNQPKIGNNEVLGSFSWSCEDYFGH